MAAPSEPRVRSQPPQALGQEVNGLITAETRVELTVPCRDLAFPPPPVTVHVKWIVRGDGGIGLLVWSAAAARAEILAWLQPLGVRLTGQGPSNTPQVVLLAVQDPPVRWKEALLHLRVDGLVLEPDGTARVRVEGAPADIDRFAGRNARSAQPDLDAHASALAPLTARQADALVLAVSLGYYQVPRRVNQKGLASMLGISNAACSELLRRAEASIVRDFVDRRFGPTLAAE